MHMLTRNILAATALVLASISAHATVRARVAHFAPFANDVNATAVNISLNGSPLLNGVKYGSFTDYLTLPGPGTYTIAVTPVAASSAVITQSITVADNTDYTVAAIGNGTLQPLELLAIADDNATPPSGQLKLRVVHTAPFAANLQATDVSIRTGDGQIIGGLGSVPYKAYSPVLTLPAATYHVKVASPDGSTNLIDAAPVALPAGVSLTVFAIGDGVNQPLGLTAIPVGALTLQGPVDYSTSGAWYNPATSGQGFTFTPVPLQDRLVGTWYTFDISGAPQWYTLDTAVQPGTLNPGTPGSFDGRHAVFAVTAVTGGAPNSNKPVTQTPSGVLTVTFSSCSQASATYVQGTTSTTIPLSNLTPFATCTIEPSP
jgi:hypothetical protein